MTTLRTVWDADVALVEKASGERLLWLEADVHGRLTICDVNAGVAVERDDESAEDVARDWLRAVGETRWEGTEVPLTVYDEEEV